MTDDDARRLHAMLDDIITAKRRLFDAHKRLSPEDSEDAVSPAARNIFSASTELLDELVGDEVSRLAFGEFPETEDPGKFRWKAIAKLAEKLRYLEPVLGAPNWQWWVRELVDELALLEAGDEPILLAPGKRQQGHKKFPGRLALLRIQALQWIIFLRESGVPVSVRDHLVERAYGERLDTIRKWRALSVKLFGEGQVAWRLNPAEQRDWAAADFVVADGVGRNTLSERGRKALQDNGDQYRFYLRQAQSEA